MWTRFQKTKYYKYIVKLIYKICKNKYIYIYDGGDDIQIHVKGSLVVFEIKSKDINEDYSIIGLNLEDAENLTRSLDKAVKDVKSYMSIKQFSNRRRKPLLKDDFLIN